MAKKRSWFFLLKKLFVLGTEPKQEKKDKRRKWILFGRAKIRGKPFPIALPSPPVEKTRDAPEPNEEQKRQAPSVAAAEAERATAHYAAEHQERAAINIQTAFRGYLARKALRALKGIVKLQAIIRGQNVRRQAMHTLKCLQSIVNIHSQACAKRTEVAAKSWNIIKMDVNSPRRWDSSALTKEEADALFISKKDAAFKRGRVREYAFNHRNSAETDRNKVNGRWRYWLDQWVDVQVSKSKELEDLDLVLTTSNLKPRVEYRGKQLNFPMLASRRTLHRKQCSLGEDNSFSGSPSVPTYMAATESAKAKSRSLSSPRLRPGNYDAYSDSHSPCKNRFNVVPSHGKFSTYQQRSPSLKGIIAGPIKSSMALKDLSFDSECSFKTWHQETAFRS